MVDLGHCRFYEREFPEVNELTLVRVARVAKDMGAYVKLLEYNNLEGLIPSSELSKRRIRSLKKLIKVGRDEVAMVLRVDPEKCYIDLSKKRVATDDIAKCEEKYSKAKKVNQTARAVAKKHDMPLTTVNRDLIWPLYRKYPHAFDGLKEATIDPEKVFGDLNCPPELVETLLEEVRLRLSPQAVNLRARFDAWCFGKGGVDAVRHAMSKGKDLGTEDFPIKVTMMAPPQYVVATTCFDIDQGKIAVKQALDAIAKDIKEQEGGDFIQQGDICLVGSTEVANEDDEDDEDADDADGHEESSEEEDEGMGRIDSSSDEENKSDDEKDDEAEDQTADGKDANE